MFVVPAAMPVTSPVLRPIVAASVLLLVQSPPAVASDKVVVSPAHTVSVPVITAGNGFTVTTVDVAQVVDNA